MRMFFFNQNCNNSNFCPDNDSTCRDVVEGWEDVYDFTEVWIRAYGRDRNPAIQAFLVTDERLTDSINGPYFDMSYSGVLAGTRLDADQTIEVWDLGADGNSRGDTLLQTVTFHASCSQPLLCLNNFGASSLVAFRTPNSEGIVSCLATVTIPLAITLPAEIFGIDGEFRFRSFLVSTDYSDPRIIELTGELGDNTYFPGDQIEFDIQVNIDPLAAETLNTRVRATLESVNAQGPTITCAVRADSSDELEAVRPDPAQFRCEDFEPLTNGFDLVDALENYSP